MAGSFFKPATTAWHAGAGMSLMAADWTPKGDKTSWLRLGCSTCLGFVWTLSPWSATMRVRSLVYGARVLVGSLRSLSMSGTLLALTRYTCAGVLGSISFGCFQTDLLLGLVEQLTGLEHQMRPLLACTYPVLTAEGGRSQAAVRRRLGRSLCWLRMSEGNRSLDGMREEQRLFRCDHTSECVNSMSRKISCDVQNFMRLYRLNIMGPCLNCMLHSRFA
jgi:hypothetical protein